MQNKYGGKCHNCGHVVAAGEGEVLPVDGRYVIACSDCAPARPIAYKVAHDAPGHDVWLTRDEILNRGTGWTPQSAYRWLGDPRRNRTSDGAAVWTLAQVEAAEAADLNR